MSNNDGVGPGGKGDKPRPINDRKKFEENFDRIFRKKDEEDNTFRWRNVKEVREYLQENKKK